MSHSCSTTGCKTLTRSDDKKQLKHNGNGVSTHKSTLSPRQELILKFDEMGYDLRSDIVTHSGTTRIVAGYVVKSHRSKEMLCLDKFTSDISSCTAENIGKLKEKAREYFSS